MKRTSSLQRHVLSVLSAGLFGLLPVSSDRLVAQCALSCINVQVSLDEQCASLVTAGMLTNNSIPSGCNGPFLIQLWDQAGNPIPGSPVVTGAYVNQQVTATVTDGATGNFCTSILTIEDKLKPLVLCQPAYTSCFENTSPAYTGIPAVTDNCTAGIVPTYADQSTQYACQQTDTVEIIDRIWSAVDGSGNLGQCLQRIYVVRPAVTAVSLPPDLDGVSAPALSCPVTETGPSATGYPSFQGQPVHGICGFLATYEDVTVPVCDGSYSIFREWVVYDGCAGVATSGVQVIQVVDTMPPQLVCPAALTVGTSNLDCAATVLLPPIQVSDLCDNSVTVTVEGAFGIITGNTIYQLGQGIHPALCRAVDGCGNESTCTFSITVVDDVPPVAVGNANAIVTLLPAEPTYVPAVAFDGGSWDNCGSLVRQVRRLDMPFCDGDESTPFDSVCPFFCCDAGKQVQVELRVTDVGGNTSTVQTSVQVFDNLSPGIVCPPPVTLPCGSDYENFSLTGLPTATDNCSGYVVTHTDSVQLNNCGVGQVKRIWQVEDASARVSRCIQYITLENNDPFYIHPTNPLDPDDDIVWPSNYMGNTCGAGLSPAQLPAGYGFPVLSADSNCATISVSYSDTYITNPSNACLEVLRNWLVIDWCQFNPTTYAGAWEYGQVIRVQDAVPPTVVQGCEDRVICSLDPACATGTAAWTVTATDDCATAAQLSYSFTVDLFSDGSIDQSGQGPAFNGILPFGTHRVQYSIQDGCGNVTTCTFDGIVRDCSAPEPYCRTLTLPLTAGAGGPAALLAARSLDDGSTDNCTGTAGLYFSFSGDLSDSLRTFLCDDLGSQDITLWVTDQAGNQSSCLATLQVVQNGQPCGNAVTVDGALVTQDSAGVGNAQVFLLAGPDTLAEQGTGAAGTFQFGNLVPGESYEVYPLKDTHAANGVTTFDMVLISKHILGNTPLDSPYKIIAADVNRSGTVTTFDLVALRKVILQIEAHFPNNTSWRFIPADFEFENPVQPLSEPFPESVEWPSMTAPETIRFIAVKIGDVNLSANPSL